MIGLARDLAGQSGDRTQQTHETEATKGRIVAIVASVAWARDRRGSEGSAGGTVTQSPEPTAQLPAAEPVASQGLNRRFWRFCRAARRVRASARDPRRHRRDTAVDALVPASGLSVSSAGSGTRLGQVNRPLVSACCCPQRKRAWKGAAAGIAYPSDRTRDSEALGLDPRPGALRQGGPRAAQHPDHRLPGRRRGGRELAPLLRPSQQPHRRALGGARRAALAADPSRREPAHQVRENPMHNTLVASLVDSVFNGGAVPIVWVIGIVLIVFGVVALFRSSLLMGVVLIVIGVLLGGLNVL